MYSNVFDSVKNSNIDLINFEGLLYSSILNGLHPTLALNQAIDSKALLALAKQKDFLELMKSGYIKVALFGKYQML